VLQIMLQGLPMDCSRTEPFLLHLIHDHLEISTKLGKVHCCDIWS
jgi:hypothetical protein